MDPNEYFTDRQLSRMFFTGTTSKAAANEYSANFIKTIESKDQKDPKETSQEKSDYQKKND